MKIRLVAFATAAEILGAREMSLEQPDNSTVGELLDDLERAKPEFSQLRPRLAVAVDGRLVSPSTPLLDGVEVALLPPVSGGRPEPAHHLTADPIDIGDVLEQVADPSCGARLLFLGCVRSEPGESLVTHLTYEAHREMAEAALGRICRESAEEGVRTAIVHRIGDVPLGEPSVAIVTASPHRVAAYQANRRALERLKREVPIWKQEHFSDGSSTWREEEPLTSGR